MNPLNAQGLQSSPLTNAAAASSSQASSSSSTDEKITRVVGDTQNGPHQATATSSPSLERRGRKRKRSQEDPPPVVLDLSNRRLSEEDMITQIQNSGGTVTLLKLGFNRPSKELLEQIAESCPQLKELELRCSQWESKWGLDQLIQAQNTLPMGVLLTNTSYSIPNRKELQKYLDYCAPFGGPTCLNLEEISDLTQSELDELIEAAPNLHRLKVKSNQLTELNAPNARVIDCSYCTGLKNISAPKAAEIYCNDCPSLQSISAPKAAEIECNDCPSLQSISAPTATIISCWGCSGLQSISAPKATWITCDRCTGLQSIDAPKATAIDCEDCINLQSISAPKVTWIKCEGCTRLSSIDAPKATVIDCRDCTGLQSLDAPNATWINCRGCTGLQSISAPKATEIYCNDCTGLQSLDAPKATRIDCVSCTGLQSLNVPLSAISGWKEDPQLSLERLQMGAKMPSPEEMKALEASHPELAQKMRKLTVLTLQDLARNCIHGNPQIETEGFPAPLLQYEDIETAYP